MDKIDFKKSLKHLYGTKKGKFDLVEVPNMQFLKIAGKGDPNTDESYKNALETLYSVAYKIKFISKKTLERDYIVPPLEGLWWADDMASFTGGDKSQWYWEMMIMTPDWISQGIYQQGLDAATAKAPLAARGLLRLESYDEGLSLQTLHIGPYDDEAPLIAHMHNNLMPDMGLSAEGKHHEIYFNDPRKTDPAKLKTMLRQPVKRV